MKIFLNASAPVAIILYHRRLERIGSPLSCDQTDDTVGGAVGGALGALGAVDLM